MTSLTAEDGIDGVAFVGAGVGFEQEGNARSEDMTSTRTDIEPALVRPNDIKLSGERSESAAALQPLNVLRSYR